MKTRRGGVLTCLTAALFALPGCGPTEQEFGFVAKTCGALVRGQIMRQVESASKRLGSHAPVEKRLEGWEGRLKLHIQTCFYAGLERKPASLKDIVVTPRVENTTGAMQFGATVRLYGHEAEFTPLKIPMSVVPDPESPPAPGGIY